MYAFQIHKKIYKIRIQGDGNLNTTTKSNGIPLNEKITLSTEELMTVLSCGRATALEIGKMAQGRVVIGRRILWNADRIRNYINTISTE